MGFLRSRHVLALLLLLVAIEAAVRTGAYEPLASPLSHAGVTIRLKRAVSSFGAENVNVVTLGDSRAAQGLDNRLILETAQAHGVAHVRLSMPGSHFLTFKTLAAWSTGHLPALRGIVLAVSADVFGRVGSGPYELAEVLPLRSATSTAEMLHHVPFDAADLRTYAPFYSIAAYREDLRALLADPAARLAELDSYNRLTALDFLAFTAGEQADICAVSTRDPALCLDELQRLQAAVPAKAWAALDTLCRAARREPPARPPGEAEERLIREWIDFLENLSHQVNVMVVLLPDHSIFEQHMYQPNAALVARSVLETLQRRGDIEFLDLHDLVSRQPTPECSYYMDARHLNKRGQQLLTAALLPQLEKFWDGLQPAGDAVAASRDE